MAKIEGLKSLLITLQGNNNITYKGKLITTQNVTFGAANLQNTEKEGNYDQAGASYYVIAVILVYGMSIVMLIASHIKRRQNKVVEDKQIHKYLQDFQIVKEKHARESYRNLKKTIIKKINWDKQRKPTYHNLQQSIMPLLVIGMTGADHVSDIEAQSLSSSLSNVDIAAAEKYMKAKDKGKINPSRKPSNAIAAAYFAAARKLSRDQSPHDLAIMYKERRMSRDQGGIGLQRFIDKNSSRDTAYPTLQRTNISQSNVGVDPDAIPAIYLEEPDSPDTVQYPGLPEFSSADEIKDHLNIIEVHPQQECIMGKSISPHQAFSEFQYPSPSTSKSPQLLMVPERIEPGSSDPSPTLSAKFTFDAGSLRSPSPVTVSSRGSPACSPYPSSSPRTPTYLSDGSREELIHITSV